MVHLDPQVLEEHPLVGVVLGAVGVALMVYVARAWFDQRLRTMDVGAPRVTTVDEIRVEPGGAAWVTLRGARWNCDLAHVGERRFPENLLFGAVEDTQIPLTGSVPGKVVIARFPGEVDCHEMRGAILTGMAVPEGDHVWGGAVSAALRPLAQGSPVIVFHPGRDPGELSWTLVASTCFGVLFALFGGYYGRKWARQRRALSPRAPEIPGSPRRPPLSPDRRTYSGPPPGRHPGR